MTIPTHSHTYTHTHSPTHPHTHTQSSKAIVPLQLDASGKVRYDAIARQGQRKDKVIHTSLSAMVQKDIRPSDPELIKPDDEEIEKVSSLFKSG